jgi:hypothetical protein
MCGHLPGCCGMPNLSPGESGRERPGTKNYRASGFRNVVDAPMPQCRILFRRERNDERFKARVAPQWVPERIETQIAVTNMAPW